MGGLSFLALTEIRQGKVHPCRVSFCGARAQSEQRQGNTLTTKWVRLFALLLCLLLGAQAAVADAKALKDRLKDIKKAWPKAPKSERLEWLTELGLESERTVDDFLLELVEKEADFDTAGEAAKALVAHKFAKDGKDLLKLYNRCKEPQRRAACVRWLGGYGVEAPLRELKDVALTDDGSAPAAALALIDAGGPEALKQLDTVSQISKSTDARRLAVGGLLKYGDRRGIDGLSKLAGIEDASFAAHYAVGGALETDALSEVLKFAKKRVNLGVGVRPHLFGSLLSRLTRKESHQAVFEARDAIDKSVDMELFSWLFSYCAWGVDVKLVLSALGRSEPDEILLGLRWLQRAPKALEGDDLAKTALALSPLLASDNDKLAGHALLAAAAAGITGEAFKGRLNAWLADKEKPQRRSAALLAAAKSQLPECKQAALELIADDCWYVASAALEYVLALRLPEGASLAFALARRQGDGRLFHEAIALLVDLTGVDFGDDLAKWEQWFSANPDFKPAEGKLGTLRGARAARTSKKTRARFYGLEIDSENVEFAIDRSISMIDPVAREPRRPAFKARKADVLKRRAEVNRLVRDGFLPRFHVAACEVAAALDGMNEKAKFGLTLFNTESVMMGDKRMVNDPESRRNALSWLLSSEIKGGTDIKAALCALCERGEADTVLVLTDGDPLSLALIEQIQRSNAFTRVNIEVVSLHAKEHWRFYLDTVARLNAGRLVEAEPR